MVCSYRPRLFLDTAAPHRERIGRRARNYPRGRIITLHRGTETMTTKKEKAQSRDEAIAYLRKILNPGDRITCTVLHVSASGMSRSIMLQVPVADSYGTLRIQDISWRVADAIGERFDLKNGGVVMRGCGMDMRFAAVYYLGRVLFPDGFGIIGERDGKRKRPATAKQAARMVRDGWRFRGRNGDASGWDNDGGYSLDYRG